MKKRIFKLLIVGLLICNLVMLSACNGDLPFGTSTTPQATAPDVTTPETTLPEQTSPEIEYEEYRSQYQAAVDKLAMFESIFKKDSRGWCVYNDIMGNAVTEVLSKQDLLIASGVNSNDVLLAGQATENLRALLKGYVELRKADWNSDYSKNKALYTYYTENYIALTQNFCDLYRTLRGLYENSVVSSFLAIKGKTEHYRQLVGQLYVVSTALNEESVRNEDFWRIDKKTLREVIEDVHYFADGDWNPGTTAFPEKEISRVK